MMKRREVPGPGQYQPEISQEFLDNKKNEIMPVSTAFQGKKETPFRELSQYKVIEVLSKNPDIGAYSPDT